jgi:transcriptional regulator with XRE-family HTH domain
MSDVNKKNFIFTPAHCRSARGLLNITQRQLADAAGISLESLRLFEKNERRPHESNLAKVMDALERRGVEFLNGGSPGVRMRPEARIIE